MCSWSMVVYELLTLQKPFAVGSIEQHRQAICVRGERPPIEYLRWLSPSVKEILQNSWEADVKARWHMQDVKESLDDIIKDMKLRKNTYKRESSFNSFGYANTNPPNSFLCQGLDMDDIILDITNTVQTRYEYVAGRIFCGKDTTIPSAADVAAKSTDLRNMKGLLKTAEMSDSPSVEAGQEVTLKGFLHKMHGSPSLSFSREVEVFPSENHDDEERDQVSNQQDAKDRGAQRPARLTLGQEEQKNESFLQSVSTTIFGSPISPTSTQASRTAATSEHFPMTSLCMHSVRLSAARNRKPNAISPLRRSSLSNAESFQRDEPSSHSSSAYHAAPSLNKLDEAADTANEQVESDHAHHGEEGLQTIKSDDDEDLQEASSEGEASNEEQAKASDISRVSESEYASQSQTSVPSQSNPEPAIICEEIDTYHDAREEPGTPMDTPMGTPLGEASAHPCESEPGKRPQHFSQDEAHGSTGEQAEGKFTKDCNTPFAATASEKETSMKGASVGKPQNEHDSHSTATPPCPDAGSELRVVGSV